MNPGLDAKPSSPVPDLSIATGGPFYRLLIRVGMMRRDLQPFPRRALFLGLAAWLPLLALAVSQGPAMIGVSMPFLRDFPVAVRFLVTVPLFIWTESVIDPRVRDFGRHLVTAGLVPRAAVPDFSAIVRQTSHLRESWLAEGGSVAVVVAIAIFLPLGTSDASATWMFVEGIRSPAGWWYLCVSIPIFQFLVCRWAWRYGIWCWFLWRVAQLELELVPTHPDRSGGLAVLGYIQAYFGALPMGFSAILSAHIAQKMQLGETLFSFRFELAGFVVLTLVLFVGPLLVFSPRLIVARRQGFLDYGALGGLYMRAFARKWTSGGEVDSDALMGSPDIQSLADMANSYTVARNMRIVPFDPAGALAPLLAATAVPFLPLALTVVSPWELIKALASVLL